MLSSATPTSNINICILCIRSYLVARLTQCSKVCFKSILNVAFSPSKIVNTLIAENIRLNSVLKLLNYGRSRVSA